MDASEYQKLAARTLITDPGDIEPRDLMIVFCAFGLAGEAGEAAEVVKKGIFHHHGLDLVKLKKEIGDALWYAAGLCTVLGISMSDVMQENIDKLKIRYPEGFSTQNSIERVDVKTEGE